MGAKVSDVQDALLALADQWERANDYRPGSEQDIVRKTMIGAVRAVANDDFDTMQSLLAYRRETAPTPYVPTRAERGAAGYVPQVGDVVTPSDYSETLFIVVGIEGNLWRGKIVHGTRADGSSRVGDSAWQYGPGAVFVRPATSSERAAAGLPVDESATKPVDREGLARAIREANFATDIIARWPWEGLNAMQREVYFKRADAAIAFMAKGGAS